MIRRVSFSKAVVAGAAGAIAWEIVIRVLVWFGLPMFDLVRVLGTLVLGVGAPAWQWWPTGMLMHAVVGSIWAIFYAYFFWSLFDIKPVLQGLLFSFLPALLAGFIMIPQMDLMLSGAYPPLRVFAISLGIFGPTSVFVGHLIYGAVLGTTYVRPVGYPAGKKIAYG